VQPGARPVIRKLLGRVSGAQVLEMFWAGFGLLGPSVLMLVYMVIATRALTPTEFGQLTLCAAVGTIMMSFTGLGAGGVMLRHVARKAELAATHLGQTIAWTAVTAPFLIAASMAIMVLVSPDGMPLWLAFAIAVSELISFRLVINCQQIFFGFGKQFNAALLGMGIALGRVLAAAFIVAIGAGDLSSFATAYLVSTLLAMAGALAYTISVVGRPRLHFTPFDFSGGMSFCLTWANTAIQGEADKLILSYFASPADVGIYNVAVRLMDGAFAPTRALRQTLSTKLYRAGAEGSSAVLKVMLKVMPLVIGYGLFAWAAIYLLTPVVVWVFGPQYQMLAHILPILGALPLVRSIADIGSDMALASDRSGFQSVMQIAATIFRVAISLVLVGLWQLDGAIATALVSSIVMGLVYWAFAWHAGRKAKTP